MTRAVSWLGWHSLGLAVWLGWVWLAAGHRSILQGRLDLDFAQHSHGSAELKE